MLRLAILIAGIVLTSGSSAQDPFLTDYLVRWENSKKYLLLVAESMPEQDYSFKPSKEEMSFGEQLAHIAWAMDWHAQNLIGNRKETDFPATKRKESFSANNKTKAGIIAMVSRVFDETSGVISGFDASQLSQIVQYGNLPRTKRQLFLILSDHVTHHRGQLMVYMRLKGIVPPQYFLYQ